MLGLGAVSRSNHPALRAAFAVFALAACRVELGPPGERAATGVAEVWIYTSMYQEVIDEMAPALARDLPDVKVEWFQSGSEKVAQRWEAEHEAGGSRACLLATSDPAWYVALTGRDLLRPYVSPRALELDRAWATPTWSAFRISLMVMASSAPEAPSSFRELADPRWKGRFSTPDPLSSGTMFTTLAALRATLGEDWIAAAKANGWVAAGGNSAVLTRMQSGEKPVGVLLLENLLAKEGAPGPIFPEEGAVPVPGPLAIPRGCPDPDAAERVYDWLMGPTAQAAVVHGFMHSPFPDAPPPAGAPPLADIRLLALPPGFTAEAAKGAEALKQRWQELGR